MTRLKLYLQNNFLNSVELLNVLGSETRLRILQAVNSSRDYTIKDLAITLNCSISNVSQQVKILKEAGLVKKIKTKDGTMRKLVVPLYSEVVVFL